MSCFHNHSVSSFIPAVSTHWIMHQALSHGWPHLSLPLLWLFLFRPYCVSQALCSVYCIICPQRTKIQVPWRAALVSLLREAVDCLEGGSVFTQGTCTWRGSLYTWEGPQWEGENGLKCSLLCAHQTMRRGTEQGLATGRNNFSFTGWSFSLPRATFF